MKTLALKLAVIRFLRVSIPQIPTFISILQKYIDPSTVPAYVPALLLLIGAVATSVDKFLREVGFYGDVRDYIFGK